MKSSLQSVARHLPRRSLYSFLVIPHHIFVFSPALWYLTVYRYPSPMLQSCNWLFFSMCNTFLSSTASPTYFFQIYLCQDHSECWLCPPALAVPPSLPPPGDLVSVLFPVGAKNGVRLSKAPEHEGTRESEVKHQEGFPLVLRALALWWAVRHEVGRHSLPHRRAHFQVPRCALCWAMPRWAQLEQARLLTQEVLGQPKVIFEAS